MSLIINLETSTTVCSVSLAENGQILATREDLNGRNHAALLTSFIGDVLDTAGRKPDELSAVAVSRGPGSYTGLRIGVSVAKGMAYALSVPLLSVETLKMMASGYLEENPAFKNEPGILLCPVIDARRMEVYSALYSTRVEQAREVKAEVIVEKSFNDELRSNRLIIFGDGARKCRDVLKSGRITIDEKFCISSRHMVHLSFQKLENKEFEDVAYFEPFYLKDFIATIPKNKVI